MNGANRHSDSNDLSRRASEHNDHHGEKGGIGRQVWKILTGGKAARASAFGAALLSADQVLAEGPNEKPLLADTDAPTLAVVTPATTVPDSGSGLREDSERKRQAAIASIAKRLLERAPKANGLSRSASADLEESYVAELSELVHAFEQHMDLQRKPIYTKIDEVLAYLDGEIEKTQDEVRLIALRSIQKAIRNNSKWGQSPDYAAAGIADTRKLPVGIDLIARKAHSDYMAATSGFPGAERSAIEALSGRLALLSRKYSPKFGSLEQKLRGSSLESAAKEVGSTWESLRIDTYGQLAIAMEWENSGNIGLAGGSQENGNKSIIDEISFGRRSQWTIRDDTVSFDVDKKSDIGTLAFIGSGGTAYGYITRPGIELKDKSGGTANFSIDVSEIHDCRTVVEVTVYGKADQKIYNESFNGDVGSLIGSFRVPEGAESMSLTIKIEGCKKGSYAKIGTHPKLYVQ